MGDVVALEKVKGDTFLVSPDELIGQIVQKSDFVVIGNKVEPTRDLMLKLLTATKITACKTELVQVVTKADGDTVYCFKAIAMLGNREADGHGACAVSEVKRRAKDGRLDHDALATAETRAMKRAIEAIVGLPFINEIILKLFGGYETPKGAKKETPQVTPSEFIKKIDECDNIPHLRNCWQKYSGNLLTYDSADKERVERHKEMRKQELKG